MAQIILGPNRAYPSIPTVGSDLESHSRALESIIEALQIHERRTKNVFDSFVRVSELQTLGLIDLDGNAVIDSNTEESTTHHHDSKYLRLDATNDPVTGLVNFDAGLTAAGATITGAMNVTGATITGLSSDDLSDVASIAMLDENENITGNWSHRAGAVDFYYAPNDTNYFSLSHSGSTALFYSDVYGFSFGVAAATPMSMDTSGVYTGVILYANLGVRMPNSVYLQGQNLAASAYYDLIGVNASDWIEFGDTTRNVQYDGTLHKFSSTMEIYANVEIRSGSALIIKDGTNADTATFQHDGTDFNLDLTNTTNFNLDGSDLNIKSGGDLRIYDTLNTDFLYIRDTGAQAQFVAQQNPIAFYAIFGTEARESLKMDAVGTYLGTGYRLTLKDSTGVDQLWFDHTGGEARIVNTSTDDIGFYVGSVEKFAVRDGQVETVNTNLVVRDGKSLYVYDATDVDSLRVYHDGTDAFIRNNAGTTDLNIYGFGGWVDINGGTAGLRIRDSGQTDWVEMSHDGTGFYHVFTNTSAVKWTGHTGRNWFEGLGVLSYDVTGGGGGPYGSFQASGTIQNLGTGDRPVAYMGLTNNHVYAEFGGYNWFTGTYQPVIINGSSISLRDDNAQIVAINTSVGLSATNGYKVGFYDATNVDYNYFYHTGTDVYVEGSGTARWVFRTTAADEMVLEEQALRHWNGISTTDAVTTILWPQGGELSIDLTAQTGAPRIQIPGGFTNTMMWMRISGYTYESGAGQGGGPWEVLVGGYLATSGPQWLNMNAQMVAGRAPFDVVKFQKGTGNEAFIQLGVTTDVWDFPQIQIQEVNFGYAGHASQVATGWSVTFETNETAIGATYGTFYMFGTETLTGTQYLRHRAGSSGASGHDWLDGLYLRIWDTNNSDYLKIQTVTDTAYLSSQGLTNLRIQDLTGGLILDDGIDLYIQDPGNTDYARFYHDGTNFYTVGLNTTTWNIHDIPNVSINRQANGQTQLRIGESSTLRGDSQDSVIQMYGQQASVIYGAQFDVTTNYMKVGGLGANPITQFVLNGLSMVGWSGGSLQLSDSDNSHRIRWIHDGSDLILDSILGTSNAYRIKEFTSGVLIHDGGGLWVLDSTDTDYIRINHTGTYADFLNGGTTAVRLRDGIPFYFMDSTDADYLRVTHDGTYSILDDVNGSGIELQDSGVTILGIRSDSVVAKKPLKILEAATAATDTGGYGQFWVKSDAPNTPWFTDDAGGDQLLDPSVSTIVEKSANYTLVLGDKGKTFRAITNAFTITIPTNASVAYPVGTLIGFQNDSGNDLTIAIGGTDTLEWVHNGATGSGNLPDGMVAVVQKVAATTWKIASQQSALSQEQTKNNSTVVTKSAAYTLILTDQGKTIRFTSGTGNLTIPANSGTAFPVGTMIGIVNDRGSNLTIAITTDTLEWVKDNTSGSRTLADGGAAVLHKVDTTLWKIAGSALLT